MTNEKYSSDLYDFQKTTVMVKFEVKPLVEWWGITSSPQICGDLKMCLNSCNVGTVAS